MTETTKTLTQRRVPEDLTSSNTTVKRWVTSSEVEELSDFQGRRYTRGLKPKSYESQTNNFENYSCPRVNLRNKQFKYFV
jgi:hypothetical protein